MSRYLTRKEDDTYIQEIESMDMCKWKINEVCCNDSSIYVADYPPQGMCENNKRCKYFEKEDGVIGDKNKI